MRAQRVVHLIPFMGSSGGGPPLSASSLAFAQIQLGLEASVLTAERPPESRLTALESEIGGLPPIDYLQDSGANPAKLWLAGRNYTFRPGTIVHVHDPFAPAAMGVAMAATRQGLPLVLSPRGSFGQWALSKKSTTKKVASRLLDRTWREASFVHFVSEGEAGSSRSFLNLPNRVIPNGVPLLATTTPRKPGRHVLFMSRLAHNKHPEVALRCFSLVAAGHPDLQLVLAGPDQDSMSADLHRLATELGIGGRLETPGAVSGAMKYDLLAGAAALIHPTEQEALSMTILEALAIGTPLVTTPGANMPELAEQDLAGVAGLESEALAAELEIALTDRGQERAARGRSYSRSNYDWNLIAKQMNEAYEELTPRA